MLKQQLLFGRFLRFVLIIAIVFSFSLTSGCIDIPDPKLPQTVQIAVNALEEAITKLGTESSNWQQILQETISKLTDDSQSTVRNEVSNTLNRAIAAAGSNTICVIDSIRDMVKEDLLRIISRLKKKPYDGPEPKLCEVVPPAIDMSLDPNRRNLLEFFGYNLDATSISATLVNSNAKIDVTSYLAKQTHYHITLNLSASGIQLSPNSNKLQLKYKDKVISEVQVLQPQTPLCQTQVREASQEKIKYLPPLRKSDREFDRNGPNVFVSVDWINKSTKIECQIYMRASETNGYDSLAYGEKITTVFTPDPGWKIDQIIGATHTKMFYTDTNDNLDIFDMGSGGPVRKFEIMGDGPGDDIERHTGVTVYFNSLRVVLKQTGNCISPSMVRTLQNQNRISPITTERFDSQLRALPQEVKIPWRGVPR